MIPALFPFKSLRRPGGSPGVRAHSDRRPLTERAQHPQRGRNASSFTMPEMVRDVLTVALLFGLLFFVLWMPEIARAITALRGAE